MVSPVNATSVAASDATNGWLLRNISALALHQQNSSLQQGSAVSLGPNTSLNHRTRYGGPSWPGLGYAVHFPSPGQAVPPQRSG